MQVCNTNADAHAVLPLTPNITVLRMKNLNIDPALTRILSCAPLLRHVEVETLICRVWENAPQTLQVLRSLPQSTTWHPLDLYISGPQAQSTVLELCAALSSAPLAQAVSKLTLNYWQVDPPIAALRATFPNVLHFQLRNCNQITAAASPLCAAFAAWPMLRTIILTTSNIQNSQESQQHLEAAARTAAELKAGQPFEVVLQVFFVGEGDATIMDLLVAAIHIAGGGKVDVRWMRG